MMPNKENLRKWVEALRSGNYQKGRGSLRRNDAYCCLGVACEVAILNDVPLLKREDDDGTFVYDGHRAYLPTMVKEWLDVDYNNPNIDGWPAAVLNDSYDDNINFDLIADRIERYYDLNAE